MVRFGSRSLKVEHDEGVADVSAHWFTSIYRVVERRVVQQALARMLMTQRAELMYRPREFRVSASNILEVDGTTAIFGIWDPTIGPYSRILRWTTRFASSIQRTTDTEGDGVT